MIKIIDTKFSVYSEVKLIGMAEIEEDKGDYRTHLSLRYPPEEEYRRYKGAYFTDLDKAVSWCREQLQESNLKEIYEREQIANEAMAQFYSQENRSKYDYNE